MNYLLGLSNHAYLCNSNSSSSGGGFLRSQLDLINRRRTVREPLFPSSPQCIWTMMFLTIISVLCLGIGAFTQSQQIDSKQLQCLVCRTTMDELEAEIAKIDPSVSIDVGNYRLDANGNVKQKSIPLARSEVHISDMLDSICAKLDDYVRATYKSTGQLTLLRIMDPTGGMNPDISKVDIVQDGDLNKSLKFYCEGIVDEFEDDIVQLFSKGTKDIDVKVCTDVANFCSDTVSGEDEFAEDDDFTERDEL
ncbi:protein seele isoform X2 [Neodiprion fabricii]|uniref:protein seele isoform X2 n=1 Tax=Neodiprion fabricii TaxID=2872261 RepID=UPI001ED91580|nr:protein seele isoform X2 [Neodiprion fabricii]